MNLEYPFSKDQTKSLTVNDFVEVTGTIFTMRDLACKYIFDGNPLPVNLDNSIIYHSGPVVVKENNEWKIISAGPTTSSRQEPYEYKLIKDLNIRAVIGKGGMGEKTTNACKKHSCCYLHTIGGAAAFLANKIKKVKGVYLLEKFGAPEAIWELEVENFPAIVTIDSKGNNLHDKVKNNSKKNLDLLLNN